MRAVGEKRNQRAYKAHLAMPHDSASRHMHRKPGVFTSTKRMLQRPREAPCWQPAMQTDKLSSEQRRHLPWLGDRAMEQEKE